MNQSITIAEFAKRIVVNAIENGKTFGMQWPNGAEYAAFSHIASPYRADSTIPAPAWPFPDISAYFFNDEAGLKEFLEAVRVYDEESGRRTAMSVYEWDFGPQPLPQHDVDANRILTLATHPNVRINVQTMLPMSQQTWDRIHGSQLDGY